MILTHFARRTRNLGRTRAMITRSRSYRRQSPYETDSYSAQELPTTRPRVAADQQEEDQLQISHSPQIKEKTGEKITLNSSEERVRESDHQHANHNRPINLEEVPQKSSPQPNRAAPSSFVRSQVRSSSEQASDSESFESEQEENATDQSYESHLMQINSEDDSDNLLAISEIALDDSQNQPSSPVNLTPLAPNAFVGSLGMLKVTVREPTPSNVSYNELESALVSQKSRDVIVTEWGAAERAELANVQNQDNSDLTLLRSMSVLQRSELVVSDPFSIHAPERLELDVRVPVKSIQPILNLQKNREILRRHRISTICGQLSLVAIRQKSERARSQISLFKDARSLLANLPENRAQLLEWLQFASQKLGFRRETYFLCQSYLDSYLHLERSPICAWQLIGVTCLYIAMKIEEVELNSLNKVLHESQSNCPPNISVQKVQEMERMIVSTLNFHLLPDTLYFWFDLAIKLWDVFIKVDEPIPNYPLFKPVDCPGHQSKYVPMHSDFQLGIANPYRVAVQALDLMSLHFQIHDYCRPNLILGLLGVQFLREVGLLQINLSSDVKTLRAEITHWASSQSDGPDSYFCLFKKFLDLYCEQMLPENFETADWARSLCSEMCFSCQFFIFPPQYTEPCSRKKLVTEQWQEGDKMLQRSLWVPSDWLSLEHYASTFQHTFQSLDSTKNQSFIMRLLRLSRESL